MDLPPIPAPSGQLTLGGFSIGHGSDTTGMTGVTVVLCPEGAVAAAELRGSATGTRQFDSLIGSHHLATRAHAVVVAGGPTVAALVAVNAFGDVRDPEGGAIVAGCRAAPGSRQLVGAERVLAAL